MKNLRKSDKMHSNELPIGQDKGRTYRRNNRYRANTNHGVNNAGVKQMTLPTLTAHRAGEASGYHHSKRVGPYLIGRLLGEGSFAKVREAMHAVVGEKVAIKIIDKTVARADFYVHKNLRREAAILQQLHHPNIVTLLEVLETDNNLYLILEICNGGPLLDLIWVQQGLSEEDARKFTHQVISAVQHLHNIGIMHRDLKVENLLLDEDGNIKLIDFGLSSYHIPTCEALPVQSACSFYDRNMTATLCGSPAYAAPEIISQKSYSPKVDVWSIGVNTFAMLTATLPFLVEPFNLRLLLRKMMNGEMSELPDNISSDAKDFVRYLLQPDPSCRPTIYEASRHPWVASRQSNPTPSPPLRRLSLMEIENDIIYEIRETFGIDPSHVMESVLARRTDEFAALYNLLHIKKQRRWKSSMNDVRRSFDKLTMDLEGNEPTEIQDIIDYTTAMEFARKKQGSPHFQMAMGMNSASERLQELEKPEGRKYHEIYQEVLYEDETSDVMASSSEAKVRLENRKISDTCRLSHTTSVASGNPWVGLMGREMSLLEGYSHELVESFKVKDNRKVQAKQNTQNNGKFKTKDGKKKTIAKKKVQHPISHVAATYGEGEGDDTELQLTTLGYQNSSSKPRTNSKPNRGPSLESIQWNGDILRSKSKTNITEKRASQPRASTGQPYDVTVQPDWSNDVNKTAIPKKPKLTKQRNTGKRKSNKKVVDEISRLYGTNRKASLAVFQNRSKDKQLNKFEVTNIHEGTKSTKKTTTAATTAVTHRNVSLCGKRLTRRPKTQGHKTFTTRKGLRKSTNQNKEENQRLIQKTGKEEVNDTLPDV